MPHPQSPTQMEGLEALIGALPAAILEDSVSPWQMLLSRDENPQHSLKWIMQLEVIQSLHGLGTLPLCHSNANNNTPWPQTGSPLATTCSRAATRWTQMQDFHASTDWPSILNLWPSLFPLPGASVLEWTMIQLY